MKLRRRMLLNTMALTVGLLAPPGTHAAERGLVGTGRNGRKGMAC